MGLAAVKTGFAGLVVIVHVNQSTQPCGRGIRLFQNTPPEKMPVAICGISSRSSAVIAIGKVAQRRQGGKSSFNPTLADSTRQVRTKTARRLHHIIAKTGINKSAQVGHGLQCKTDQRRAMPGRQRYEYRRKSRGSWITGTKQCFSLRTENVIWATSCCSRLISGLLLRQNIAVHPRILLCALCVVLQPLRQQIDKSHGGLHPHHHRRIRLIPRQEIIIHHRHPTGVFPHRFPRKQRSTVVKISGFSLAERWCTGRCSGALDPHFSSL